MTLLRNLFQKKYTVFAIFFIFLLIILLRDTRYLSSPRFWAEEGTLHFAFSYSHSWLPALFQPQVGYLNFWANLATLLATWVPLQAAPLITTLLALIVQIIPIGMILWSQSPLWASWIVRLAGVAIFLFAPLTQEVWLNSVTSFAYFAVITFLILLEESPAGAARRWFYRILLVLAGLTGTLSCFLIPLYILRAWWEKDRERGLQTTILTFCAIVQVLLILSDRSNINIGQRFHLLGITTLGITLWTQTLALFTAGFQVVNNWAYDLFAMTTRDLPQFLAIGRLLLPAGVVLILLLSTNLSWLQRILFIGGYASLMVLSMMFSVISDKYTLIDTGLHSRLFLAPNIILGWMMLFGIRYFRGKNLVSVMRNAASIVCLIVISTALFWGITSFRASWNTMQNWPDWKQEVETWRANPDYALQIQPDGWTVRLPK